METLDARLLEARTDLENAKQAQDAGHEVQALAWAQNALRLREAVLGGTHLDVVTCLEVLGELYWRNRDLSQAEQYFQRALAIREEAPGTSPLQLAASLDKLAGIYTKQGLTGRAEPLYERALVLREEALGGEHLQVASALDRLALVYSDQGRYAKAEHHYQRALAIRKAVLGKEDVATASILQHLADLYRTQGVYERAEPLYLHALDIQEKALGSHHPKVATVHNHLAELYEKQGLDKQVEHHYELAFKILSKLPGEKNPQFTTTLKGLASLHQRQGRYEEAETNLLRVLEMREKVFGKIHPRVATVLDLLGRLYWERGDHAQAKQLYERALTMRKATLGKDHISVALTYNNLARLYWKQGDYAQAERHYDLARAIWEKALGETHPFVAINLRDLAQLRLAQNRLPDAVSLFTRAFAIFEQRLRQEGSGFSESRLAEFLDRLHESEQVFYSLARAHPNDAQVRRLALSSVLLLKGRSAEETAHIYRALQRMSPKDRSLFEDLRRLRVRLADLRSHAGYNITSEERRNLDSQANEGDVLEADLAKISAEQRTLTALPSPKDIVDRVADQLPRDSALVEFILYGDSPPVPPLQTPPAQLPSQSQLRYLALVLFPDASTRAVDLGPAEPIDTTALHLRNQLSKPNTSAQALAQELYRSVWKPLLPVLGATRRIWLSPDGQLGIVPFSALHDGHDFLLESFNFTYLTSGKQLLLRSQQTPSSSAFVLAIPSINTPTLDALSLDPGFQFPPLTHVKEEADGIQRRLPQSHVFLGIQATRELLFNLSSPGILHIATHGYFLGEYTSSGDLSRGLVRVSHFLAGVQAAVCKESGRSRSGFCCSCWSRGVAENAERRQA